MKIDVHRGFHLTVRHLKLMSACSEQVDIFKTAWPSGVDLTRKALLQAATLHLDIDWFARRTLPSKALAVYRKATDEAWAVRNKAMDEARAVHYKATAEVLTTYNKATAEALWKALPRRRSA